MAQEMVSVPRRLLEELVQLLQGDSAETVSVRRNGLWTRDMLRSLHQEIADFKGATGLLDIAAADPGQTVRFPEVAKATGLPPQQVRNELAAMSRSARALFGERIWPIVAWQSSDGVMAYQMPSRVADWWSEIRKADARKS